jgi:hypothetical protein
MTPLPSNAWRVILPATNVMALAKRIVSHAILLIPLEILRLWLQDKPASALQVTMT